MLNYADIATGILILPAIFMWKSLYTTYRSLNQQYKQEELFYKQHNCVVMYSKSHIRGWPPEYEVIIDNNNFRRSLEPYLCFINTAKKSIDIAMMRIAINPLFDALEQAVKKGVEIRLIVDFSSVKSTKKQFLNLIKLGAKLTFFIDKTEKLNNIMHCKYMVKDYDGTHGYLCMGSLNFTSVNSVLNNFEDVTFTSNISVVEEFHKSFLGSWEMIQRDNQNEFNKSALSEHGFL